MPSQRSSTDRALLRLLEGQGGILTAGEAAARSGQRLDLVETRLLALAVAVAADLRVSEDGSLAYSFPRDLRRRLLARSWRLRLEAAGTNPLRERRIRFSRAGANPRHRQLLESKRAFARRFSRRIRLGPLPLAYTTERDLLDQRLQP